MEGNAQDPNSKPGPADEPELDVYTIPAYSRWFSWDSIHDTEVNSLGEFFDGTSISRTPRIYKEYRDFLISKYREEPSRRLTFTEVRKTLVGDVSLLRKVFLFLEKWGLINFSAPSGGQFAGTIEGGGEESSSYKVRVEEGPPQGVRVVANPSSLKPLSVPQITSSHGEYGFKFAPLGSYSDVYGDLKEQKGPKCANCQELCDSGHYENTKESSTICGKCFKSGNYGENKSADDFKFKDCTESNSTAQTNWAEAENLLLLDSVLKHGDDWDLVAQNVKTKSKLECISKLLEMPFGDIMLGSYDGKITNGDFNGTMNSTKQSQFDSSESRETINPEDQCNVQVDTKQIKDAENQGPPLKRTCIASVSDADNSLVKQVAHISAKFPPNITASAVEAAIMALCEENPGIEGLFNVEGNSVTDGIGSSAPNGDPERAIGCEGSEIMKKLPRSETGEMSSEKKAMPLTLRFRATVAAALGASAAHAKSLADNEVSQMEQLVAAIIETQLEKMNCKLKHFEDLEKIMGQEYDRIEELKESILAEWIGILQKACDAGISRWRHYNVKS